MDEDNLFNTKILPSFSATMIWWNGFFKILSFLLLYLVMIGMVGAIWYLMQGGLVTIYGYS